MMYIPLQLAQYEKQASLDTGAIQSAMSETELRTILTTHPSALFKGKPALDFRVRIANGKIVPVRKQVLLRFFIAENKFEETFIILPTKGNILFGISFLNQPSVTLDIRNQLIYFPDVSLPLCKANGRYNCDIHELRATQKIVLLPYQQVMVPVGTTVESATTTGTVVATTTMNWKKAHLVTPPCSNLRRSTQICKSSTHHDHISTINAGAIPANFTVLKLNQAKHVQLVAPKRLSLLIWLPDDATAVINQLFDDELTKTNRMGYPTLEICQDPQTLNPLERWIYDSIVNLMPQEKLDPTKSNDQRQTFLSRFNWDDSHVTKD